MWVLVALGVVVGTCFATMVACLPDLPALEVGGTDAAQSSLRGCGDRIIETLDDGGDAGESCDPGDAQPAGCSACQVRCEGRLDPATGHCYFDGGEFAAYADAVRHCSAADGHVVTFVGPRETALVDGFFGATPYWVGLAVDNQKGGYAQANELEPGWPLVPGTCPGCFAVVDDAGAFGDGGASSTAQANCLVASAGAWLRVPCFGGSTPFRTVCEREPVGRRSQDCGGGLCFTLPETVGKKRYFLVVAGVSAADARSTCLSAGGSLVLLDSAEEREQLAHELAEVYAPFAGTLNFWVDVHKDATLWRWDDDAGETLRAIPWGNQQPAAGGSSAFMQIDTRTFDSELLYADEGTDAATATARPFVCQR